MLDFLTFVFVFLVSLFAAFIDVAVGGSSLVVVPVLTILGFSIYTVIGTNRLYVVIIVLVGLLNYIRKQIPLDIRMILSFIVVRMLGALAGSALVLQTSKEIVKLLVAILMLAAVIAIFFLRTKKSSRQKKEITWKKFVLVGLAMLFLGFYVGFVGGGAGTISRVLLVLLLGYTLLEAALAELVISFFESGAASVVFITNEQVDYALLVPMVLGGVIGAYIGSHMAMKKGEEWLRKLLVIVVIALILKMLFL